MFLNKDIYREVLLAPRPTPKLEDHPSSAVSDCLFIFFAATLLIGDRSSIRNLRTRHAVVTGTHYKQLLTLISHERVSAFPHNAMSKFFLQHSEKPHSLGKIKQRSLLGFMQTRGKPSVRLHSHFLDLRQINQALYTLVYTVYTKSYFISLNYIVFQHLSQQT